MKVNRIKFLENAKKAKNLFEIYELIGGINRAVKLEFIGYKAGTTPGVSFGMGLINLKGPNIGCRYVRSRAKIGDIVEYKNSEYMVVWNYDSPGYGAHILFLVPLEAFDDKS